MIYFFIILLFLIFLFFLIFLLLLPVKFRFEFKFIGEEIYFEISSSYLFGVFSPEIYPLDSSKRKKTNYDDSKALKNIIKELQFMEILKYTWEKLEIEKFEFKKTIGSDNPYITSILYGLLWSIEGVGISYLLKTKEINSLDIDIIPIFEENRLDITFDCIIKIKMVYIINIWFRLIKLYKGGGKDVRTSNRRIDEVYNE